jgi:AraC-like DNA-binding protein
VLSPRWTQSYIAVIAGTLSKTCVAESAGFRLDDVRCGCGRASWSAPEQVGRYSIVFVRRGCFRRRVGGAEFLLDPATAYLERPGEEYRVAHPAEGGDACTQLTLPPELIEDGPHVELRFTRPDVDLAQRLLVRAPGDDEVEFVDRAVAIADMLLDSRAPRAAAARAAAAAARRRVVEVAREAIAHDSTLDLVALARAAAVSPHHLSRTFRAETGETVSRYRNRIRVRLALERLAEGEDRLARLAAELGFADQAHLSRVVREEVRRTPTSLRAALRPKRA